MLIYLTAASLSRELCYIGYSYVRRLNISVCSGKSKENDDSERTSGQTRKTKQQHAVRLEEWIRGLQVGDVAGVDIWQDWASTQTVIPHLAVVLFEGVSLLHKHSAFSFITLLSAELQLSWGQQCHNVAIDVVLLTCVCVCGWLTDVKYDFSHFLQFVLTASKWTRSKTKQQQR